MDDGNHLRAYYESGAEDEFRHLVDRHLALVFSAAHRRLYNHALAEEATQDVFLLLARKGRALCALGDLSGWLYSATLRITANMIRAQKRRNACQERLVDATSEKSEGASTWDQLRPILDETVALLSDKDRQALLLRYFEGRTLREVGLALEVGEDAAEKRVARALDRLRGLLRGRGMEASVALLAHQVATRAIEAAPASLTAIITKAAAATTGAPYFSSIVFKLTSGIAMDKLQTVGVCLAIAVVPLAWQWISLGTLRTAKADAEAQARGQVRQISELQATRTSLQAEVEQLRARLRERDGEAASMRAGLATQTGQQAGTGKPAQETSSPTPTEDRWDNDPDFVRVRKTSIGALTFDGINVADFQVTSIASDVLELTAQETERLQAVLDKLKDKIQAHDIANLKEVAAEDVRDPDIVRFYQDKTGQKTAYRVVSPTEPERAEVLQWFGQSVEDVVGNERKALFLKSAVRPLDFWLNNREDKIIAFIDRFDAEERPVEHEFMVRFNTPTSSGTISGSGNTAIPQHVAYLFEAVSKAKQK